MGFANLQLLESRLSTLSANLAAYKAQRDEQKKRKSDIKSIINHMKRTCSDRMDDINLYLNAMIDDYEAAMKGILSVSSLVSVTTSDKEKELSSDGHMSSAYSKIQSELEDVCKKIEELENRIQACQSQISTCETSIRSEQRSIARSFSGQYSSAEAKVDAARIAYNADPTSAQLKRAYERACSQRDAAKNNYDSYRSWL